MEELKETRHKLFDILDEFSEKCGWETTFISNNRITLQKKGRVLVGYLQINIERDTVLLYNKHTNYYEVINEIRDFKTSEIRYINTIIELLSKIHNTYKNKN